MLTEYETGFTISQTSELAGNALLTEVADRLEAMLSDGHSDASSSITEREISASSGYAVVSADHPHPFDSEHILRIQARLCTQGEEITAQIRSRFISADDNDPADLTAGPPRILKEIVANYDCEIGPYGFKNEVIQVDNDNMADDMMEFIKDSSRKIPVLVLTEYYRGGTAIEPQAVLDYLLGLALVVRFRGGTAYRIKEATGRRCDNGGMRFYWPQDSVGRFYWPVDATRNGLTQYQRDVIANADLHDLNGDFEQVFSAARTRVIRERRVEQERTAQNEVVAQLAQAQARIQELERQAEEADAKHSQTVDDLLEQLNAARTDATSDSDEGDKGKEALRQSAEIAQLRRIRKKLETDNQELRQENRDLTESLEHAKTEAAAAKMPVITDVQQEVALTLTGNPRLDNITILNHAINIYRDPTRRYIIKAIRKFNDTNSSLYTAIEPCIRDDSDRRRLQESIRNNRPQDGIDVGHFEHIVMDNRACFGAERRLSTRLADVRQVRNTAAHPETNGIDNTRAKDGINKIARALREMGNNDDSKIVEQLLPLVQ